MLFRKAIALWKKEKDKKRKTTMYRRLLLFFVLISVSIVSCFALLLHLFGITGKQGVAVAKQLTTELSIVSNTIDEDFGRVSVGGIAIAEDIADRCDEFFRENGMRASQLQDYPELLEPLLREQIHTLISTVNNRYCGGAFIMLDATVNPQGENAENAKSGIFLKKTQPTTTSVGGVDIHCLRGPAQIARDNDIMLIGQWHMEYDITDQDFFKNVMEKARENPNLPLSRLYYWSGRVTLKGNSEAGFLLCVPLRSDDGTVFGLCGIEVSDRLFKSFYTPEGGGFDSIFAVMAPVCQDGLCTSRGILAGNSYLTGTRWDFDLSIEEEHDGFIHYSGGEQEYGGKVTEVRLYPSESPYAEEKWAVAILLPKDILHDAVVGNQPAFMITVVALIIISILASVYISKRYLDPVNKAIHSIRNTPHDERENTIFTEINDLFDFLAFQDKENEQKIQRLHKEKSVVEAHYETAQTYITHLAEERMPEVEAHDFEIFLRQLHTLTPKEREIFDYYLAGKKAKEIMDLSGINQNTLKYHNKNIYSKLGVTSRKQLTQLAVLMKYKKE